MKLFLFRPPIKSYSAMEERRCRRWKRTRPGTAAVQAAITKQARVLNATTRNVTHWMRATWCTPTGSPTERIYCHRILVQNWIYLDRRQFRNPDLSSCAFYINTPYRWREALTTVGTSSGKPAQRRDQIFFHPPEVSIGLHP